VRTSKGTVRVPARGPSEPARGSRLSPEETGPLHHERRRAHEHGSGPILRTREAGWRSEPPATSPAPEIGPRPGDAPGRPRCRGRSTLAPILFQLFHEVTAWCHGKPGRRGRRDRLRWRQPTFSHQLRQSRLGGDLLLSSADGRRRSPVLWPELYQLLEQASSQLVLAFHRQFRGLFESSCQQLGHASSSVLIPRSRCSLGFLLSLSSYRIGRPSLWSQCQRTGPRRSGRAGVAR